jgi:hypothetical protein
LPIGQAGPTLAAMQFTIERMQAAVGRALRELARNPLCP